jgi:hypothetical protein
MEFEQMFETQRIPEWYGKYFDYKFIKKAIGHALLSQQGI